MIFLTTKCGRCCWLVLLVAIRTVLSEQFSGLVLGGDSRKVIDRILKMDRRINIDESPAFDGDLGLTPVEANRKQKEEEESLAAKRDFVHKHVLKPHKSHSHKLIGMGDPAFAKAYPRMTENDLEVLSDSEAVSDKVTAKKLSLFKRLKNSARRVKKGSTKMTDEQPTVLREQQPRSSNRGILYYCQNAPVLRFHKISSGHGSRFMLRKRITKCGIKKDVMALSIVGAHRGLYFVVKENNNILHYPVDDSTEGSLPGSGEDCRVLTPNYDQPKKLTKEVDDELRNRTEEYFLLAVE
eukprot:Lankesteria_metandrocarpae@DN1368_c0_g1_i1.p1